MPPVDPGGIKSGPKTACRYGGVLGDVIGGHKETERIPRSPVTGNMWYYS